MHRISENSGTSMKADSTPTAAAPTKMPISAVHDRQPHRDHGAEREQQHDDRDADADQLAARRLLLRAARAAPVSSTCTPAARAASRRRSGVVELRGRELVDRVGDVDVGRLPVGADGGGLRTRTGR